MLGKDADAKQEALGIMRVWVDFANKTGAVLVAPVFTDEDYGAGTGCPHGWGYRALYGRHVGADAFLHEITASLRKLNPDFDGKVFLFGHSAGGQFVSHYVVKHPDRVHSAVISAAAWLPFPTMDDDWPRGMKRRATNRLWPGESEKQYVEVIPDPEAFVAAAQLPLLVTCGALDLEDLGERASQGGNTHVARAQAWARDMNAYADMAGKTGKVTCQIVPNVGHAGGQMSRASMPFLTMQMRQLALGTPRQRSGRTKR
jgi:pimeloyl-ACP methyl ester carboxylesterase